MSIFQGLSAFPLTPATPEGRVNVDALGTQVAALCRTDVDSIGLLGSTGIYAYLDRSERHQAVAAAVRAAAGAKPLIVGVGALRTSWAIELAEDAAREGADGLLLPAMSYTPLSEEEVAAHVRAVADATDLPLCLYDNPGTTHFAFSHDLVAELADHPRVASVKLPPAAPESMVRDIAALRARTPAGFALGYSGDWIMGAAMLAGADVFFSAIAGTLPGPLARLVHAAQAGDADAVSREEAALAPLWALVEAHGSLRIAYALADHLDLAVGQPPAPIRPLPQAAHAAVAEALAQLTL